MSHTVVCVDIQPQGDDPFKALPLDREPPLAIIRAGQATIFISTVAQADSLIRAAVAAKDMHMRAVKA